MEKETIKAVTNVAMDVLGEYTVWQDLDQEVKNILIAAIGNGIKIGIETIELIKKGN